MSEYSQGVCEDGAAILKDGLPMTIEQILNELRSAQRPSAVVPECAACVSPELHYETQRGLSCKSDTQSAVVPSGVWQFYQDGEWHTGMNNIRHRADTEAAGYKVRDLWVNQEQDPFN
jgi:hypothetical protein